MTDDEIITIEVDFAADAVLSDAVRLIEKHEGSIVRLVSAGVDGDNTTMFIQFNHYVLAENFLMEYCGDSDVESYEVMW